MENNDNENNQQYLELLELHKKNMRIVLMTVSIIPLFYSLTNFFLYVINESEKETEDLIRICRNAWKNTEYDFSRYSFARFDDDDENGNDKYQIVFDTHNGGITPPPPVPEDAGTEEQ